jgi:intein/homing endonuclease
MSYKKHFKNTTGAVSPISGANSNASNWNTSSNHQDVAYKNYMSRLPEVYTGHPNRIDRYNQYEMMDVDAEINACLDIISEFSTQKNEHNNTPFSVEFTEQPTPHEVELIKTQLQQWCKLNEFEKRIFKIFRNTLKYGDQVFVRDPENFKLYWVDMSKVVKVIVNESEGKLPEQYVIKDLNINLQNLTVAQKTNTDFAANPATGSGGTGGGGAGQGYTVPAAPYNTTGSRFTLGQSEVAIDAKHVVHVSLTEGLDRFWPFGQSILENVFKVYKQKELLEDAVLIYRVQRAPERRMFKIDVGNMPSHLAMAFVERVKNEIHQRRIPSPYGGNSVVDATYNPLSTNEDYFFPVTADGRGSSVEVLPGGCLAMDTKVSLLDGRELSIADISDEIATGKELWTYSCDPVTGKVVPGLISWAGMTQESAKVLKITLDSGESIICTPDHKFPTYDKEKKRADEFVVGDSLIPLYRRKELIDGRKKHYEQCFDNSIKEWKFTHRIVASELRDTMCGYQIHNEKDSNNEYEVIHHKDFNRFNNEPCNLVWMASKDHYKYHLHTNVERWNSYSPERRKEITDSMSIAAKEHINSLSPEAREKRANDSRNAFKQANVAFNERMNSDPEFYADVIAKRMEYWTDENRHKQSNTIREWNYINWSGEKGDSRKKHHSNLQRMEFTHDMLKAVIKMIDGKTTHQVTAIDIANELNKTHFKEELITLNKEKKIRNWKPEDGFTEGNLRRGLITTFGYKNWKEFRTKHSLHNHVIVSIEWLADHIPVGTLTIDSGEIYHNYHNFALTCGVFTQNSNLGEIDDLRYFNNRLARGLRVPSSYLPTGPDDNTTPLSDGRVGTAMIQEFRFNQYCERLQNYMSDKLDQEFKMFMRWRGFNIDSGLFTITFNPPQNFAAYRQSELDSARVSTFTTMEQIPYISKRFALERFLGLSEEEIAKNEKLWEEENAEDVFDDVEGSDLRNVGVSVGDFSADQGLADEIDAGAEEGAEGADVAGPVSDAGGVLPPPGE